MSTHEVAADAWPLIDAFRKAGARSFEQLGVDEARAAYEATCARNGIEIIEMASVRDLAVGTRTGLRARLYEPAAAPSASPVVLFLHGGGWVIGSLDTHDRLCRFLAHHTKTRVLSVDYRLAPEHPFPAAIEDARDALHWLCSHPADLGPAPTAIVIAGDSAGGGLAAVLAAEYPAQEDAPTLAAQLLLYPVTDLTMSTPSYLRVTEGFPLTAATMGWFADLYANGADRTDPSMSPMFAAQPAHPAPAFVCTVGHDPLADEGIRYAALLASAGARLAHVHLPHHAHGVFTSSGVIETGRVVMHEAATFVRLALASHISA